MYYFKKNSDLMYNQLRLKLLYKNTFQFNEVHTSNIKMNINLLKLKYFNDESLL